MIACWAHAYARPENDMRGRRQELAAADQYLTVKPDPDKLLKPSAFARVITLLLNAHRLTRQQTYLDHAALFGRTSRELFLTADLPLPRATNKHDHCEAITGGPDLMLALLDLHRAGASSR